MSEKSKKYKDVNYDRLSYDKYVRSITEELTGSFDAVIAVINQYKSSYPEGFIVSEDCGMDEGYRLALYNKAYETDDNMQRRIATEERLVQEQIDQRKILKEKARQRELAELARLKAKYPDQ